MEGNIGSSPVGCLAFSQMCIHMSSSATATSDIEIKIPIVVGMNFPTKWLDSINLDDADGRTNRELIIQVSSHALYSRV